MQGMDSAWWTDVAGWSAAHWERWDQIVNAEGEGSFHLDSRTVRALFADRERKVSALVWHASGSPDDPAAWRGVALVEDTFAESHGVEKHLASRSWGFRLASRVLHGQDGVLRFPVRVMGSVLGSGGHAYRFLPEVDSAFRREQVSSALQSSLRTHPGPRVALVKDFPQAADGFRWHRDWVDLEFDPVMVLPLNPAWNSLEDYLGELRTKSRTKVKRILACSDECTLEVLSLAEVEAQLSELHGLYRQVYGEASFRLGTLLPEDLVAAKRSWGDAFRVQVIRHGGRLVAFQCGFLTATTVEAFFVGFERSMNRDLSLYQRMLLEFIRWGIDSGAQQVNMGRTALDIKSSIGGLSEAWCCAVWFKSPFLHRLAQFAARRSWPQVPELKRPWKQDAYPVVHPPQPPQRWL